MPVRGRLVGLAVTDGREIVLAVISGLSWPSDRLGGHACPRSVKKRWGRDKSWLTKRNVVFQKEDRDSYIGEMLWTTWASAAWA